MGCNSSANNVVTVEDLRGAEVATESARSRRRSSSSADEHSRAGPAERAAQTATECHDRLGSKGSLDSTPSTAREDFVVRVHKRAGDVLGAGLGNTDKGAVIFNVQENGLLDGWNKANPDEQLYSGLIIAEVNGITGYWSILEELRRPGVLTMKITAIPPKNAGPNWYEEIADMGRNLEAQGGKSSFMLRLHPQDGSKSQTFSSLPTIRAGDCGVDQCAICIDDVNPDETLVQLPCGHAFHALCAARWLTQAGKHSQGKRQCCPLCCRKVVGTADGGISTAEK